MSYYEKDGREYTEEGYEALEMTWKYVNHEEHKDAEGY